MIKFYDFAGHVRPTQPCHCSTQWQQTGWKQTRVAMFQYSFVFKNGGQGGWSP